MPFNTARHIKLPMRNSTLQSHNSKLINSSISGGGMGSVLLSTGGAGSASSYYDIDEYIHTTGINPYARAGVNPVKPSGTGLSKITSKLSKLSVVPDGVKRKNITMSF